MKKILVPTDFSDNAYSALCYAAKLYSGEVLQITILHSFSDEIDKLTSRVDIGRSETMREKFYKQYDDEGEQLLEKLKQDAPKQKHTFDVINTPATLAKSINSLVASDGYDLVVMGSKGRTAAEEVLMGSTTASIVKTLDACPLLIVPEQVEFSMPTSIAFASDFNEFYPLSKLKPVTRLVRQYNSRLNIVHVGSEADLEKNQNQNLEKFENDLTEYEAEFYFVPKKDTISKTLYTFMDEKSIDLFVLIYHKHNFIKQLFREPVVSRVGKHTYIPTLVIPQNY
ncbi:universal stress protein [Aequorivita capsosiphonis]|uniref:universal stress protein n=1 Tax=Aequorivita capsosiphonis TaxID=487317 RepID=UPI00041DDD1F|nr:universal stress protein [Aequorivita capsosiphonis]